MTVAYYLPPDERDQPCQHPDHATTGRGSAVAHVDGGIYCPRDLAQFYGFKAWNWQNQIDINPGRQQFSDKGFLFSLDPLAAWPADIAEYSVPKLLSAVRPNDITPPGRTYDLVASYTSDAVPPQFVYLTSRWLGTDLRGAGVAEALQELNADVLRTGVAPVAGTIITTDPLVAWREI